MNQAQKSRRDAPPAFSIGMPGMTLCTSVQADQMWRLTGDLKVQVLYGP